VKARKELGKRFPGYLETMAESSYEEDMKKKNKTNITLSNAAKKVYQRSIQRLLE